MAAFHQSTVHSSPLLYDIDKDGTREIALATYNGAVIFFFRVSGYLMMDKLEVPRRKVHKNWYVGLDPDPVDCSHPDVHDDLIAQENSAMNSISHINGSMNGLNNSDSTSVVNNPSKYASKPEDKGKLDSAQISHANGLSSNLNDTFKQNVSLGNVTEDNQTQIQRRLLEVTDNKSTQDEHSEDHNTGGQGATVENDQEMEEEADSSFDLLRDTDELADGYNYDYDDYVDESMLGNENLDRRGSSESRTLCKHRSTTTLVSAVSLYLLIYQSMSYGIKIVLLIILPIGTF